MADCLIFHDGVDFNLVVCELKGSNPNQKIIAEQIQMGVNYALSTLESIQESIQLYKAPKIILVVLTKKSKIKPSLISYLRRANIHAQGRNHPIFARQCGSKFSDIVELIK